MSTDIDLERLDARAAEVAYSEERRLLDRTQHAIDRHMPHLKGFKPKGKGPKKAAGK